MPHSRNIVLLLVTLLPAFYAKPVKYTLRVSYFRGAPDGVYRDNILGINGQFPGPTLEANVGDTLRITLVNNIQDGQNTSLHWHGIHQRGSAFDDGASMVNQCPLPQGKSMVYQFKLSLPGTYWYHSHVGVQYSEGLFGPLIVHAKPEAYKYDGEFTLTLSDWYHRTAKENEEWHLKPESGGSPPFIDSALINGHGRYPCQYAEFMNLTCNPKKQLRSVFKVEKDKLYRIRLINSAANTPFNFSIEGHKLDVIEVDGVDVAQPVEADIIPIAAGQRYSFLFKCNGEGRSLIRANIRNETLVRRPGYSNINKFRDAALITDITSVIECTDDKLRKSKHLVEESTEVFTFEDAAPALVKNGLVDIDEMKLIPLDGIQAPDYFDEEFVLHSTFYEDQDDIRRASFNFSAFFLPEDKPLLMKVLDGEDLPSSTFPLEIKYGSVVQVVINNPFVGPHPFHLHGHHFWVLGMGKWADGNYDAAKHSLTVNGVRRDTVMVQTFSWAVIRFVADNPGVWLFHCHIDWHALTGMAVTFVEGKDVLRNTTVVTKEAARVCKMH